MVNAANACQVDSSQLQLKQAPTFSGAVEYRLGDAHQLPCEDASVDLVTVAQVHTAGVLPSGLHSLLPVPFLPAVLSSCKLCKQAVVNGAAQALHWFDRPRFYAEAARVLKTDTGK
jgi:hypothetical protein